MIPNLRTIYLLFPPPPPPPPPPSSCSDLKSLRIFSSPSLQVVCEIFKSLTPPHVAVSFVYLSSNKQCSANVSFILGISKNNFDFFTKNNVKKRYAAKAFV